MTCAVSAEVDAHTQRLGDLDREDAAVEALIQDWLQSERELIDRVLANVTGEAVQKFLAHALMTEFSDFRTCNHAMYRELFDDLKQSAREEVRTADYDDTP